MSYHKRSFSIRPKSWQSSNVCILSTIKPAPLPAFKPPNWAKPESQNRLSKTYPKLASIPVPKAMKGPAYILLINLSLLTGLPFFPALVFGVSVHISFTFSSTILQCLSKAFTRASSFLLFRQEIRTWLWERTAVWRILRGPEENSCSSSCAISYSLKGN